MIQKKAKLLRSLMVGGSEYHQVIARCLGCYHFFSFFIDREPFDSHPEEAFSCSKTQETLAGQKVYTETGKRCPLKDFKIEYCTCGGYECPCAKPVWESESGETIFRCHYGKRNRKPGDCLPALGPLGSERIPIPESCMLEDWDGGQNEM